MFLTNCIMSDEDTVIESLDLLYSKSLPFLQFQNRNKFEERRFESCLEDDDLEKRKERFINDKTVQFPLPLSLIDKIFDQYEKIKNICDNSSLITSSELIKKVMELKEKSKRKLSQYEKLQLIAIGAMIISREFNFKLQSTQILTVLALINFDNKSAAQVLTGERKTFIGGLFIFFVAVQGHGCDYITSSRTLSIRDWSMFSQLFAKFNITTSNISVDDQEIHHFRAQILYGTASDFEFALMRDMLKGTKLFAERAKFVPRNFDYAIVDEKDNMTIDTATSSARIAYTSKSSFHWIYAPILKFVREFHPSTSTELLRKYLKNNLQSNWCSLVDDLSDHKLEEWIRSANVALIKKRDVHYVLKSKKDNKGNLQRCIQIADVDNTGRIMESSRWSAGIHEFLEVKHEIEVEKESHTPIALSHSNFYQLYDKICGLSGTLGNFEERKEVEDLYHVKSFDIPPHLPSKRQDLPRIICSTDFEFFQILIKRIDEGIKNGNPMLILCSSIEETYELAKIIEQQNIDYQLYNEMQKEDDATILARSGKKGTITIATNTASRGTDIRLEPGIAKKVGLKVIITFPAKNHRVLNQMLGRAGRGGDPGTTEIILSLERGFLKKYKGLQLSQQEILSKLDTEMRTLDEQEQEMRIKICELERINHQFVERFFEQYQQWLTFIEKEDFLNYHSLRLSKSRFLKRPDTQPPLQSSEEELIDQCINLLVQPANSKVDPLQWKVLLKRLIEVQKDEILTKWCVNFYHEIQNCTMSPKSPREHKEYITALFEKERITWESLFDTTGTTLFKDLKKRTGLDLSKDRDL